HLTLLGAGREKRIYAVPPHTDVVPLDFEDYPFRVEEFAGRRCARCGSTGSYLDEIVLADGRRIDTCSDTAYCDSRLAPPPRPPCPRAMAEAATAAPGRGPDRTVPPGLPTLPRAHRSWLRHQRLRPVRHDRRLRRRRVRPRAASDARRRRRIGLGQEHAPRLP